MLRLFLAIALALGIPGLAFAQQPTAGPWARGGDRITLTSARISFPLRAGTTTLTRSLELSQRGTGTDNALQYVSRDEQVFATVYIYYPGLPHAGVSAFATDHAIRIQSGSGLRPLGSRIVAAGGRDGVAIRADYAGFRDERLASSAAFIKAGRWIVKLRVSGPENRRAEVERTMTALLDGLRFEGEIAPRPAEPLEVADCRSPPGRRAALLASSAADALEEVVIGVLDGAGGEGRERRAEHRAGTPLIGSDWCVSALAHVDDAIVPILRADGRAGADRNRSVLIAIISDSGGLMELVQTRRRNRYVLLRHQIGQTVLLGAFDAPPTDEQIVAILTGDDPRGGEARATVVHKADGNTDVTLHVEPDEPRAGPTT